MIEDFEEQTNLAAAASITRKGLEAQMESFGRSDARMLSATEADIAPELAERLRALGYIQ